MDKPLPQPMPPEPIPPDNKTLPRPWIIASGVVITGIVALLIVSKLSGTPEPPTTPVIEVSTPTPTPIRVLSAIASQSAYVALENSHTSLSASLNGTNLDDPSLSPPVLDLPLGFKQ